MLVLPNLEATQRLIINNHQNKINLKICINFQILMRFKVTVWSSGICDKSHVSVKQTGYVCDI